MSNDPSQATIESNTISGNMYGIRMEDSCQATITRNVIQNNGGYGVVLNERPCFDTDDVFTGHVAGAGNTGGENTEGEYYPDELDFLMTEEGGELDRRE